MASSRKPAFPAAASATIGDTLIAAGLEQRLAKLLQEMPHRAIIVEPRRPFREPGVARDEVMFVKSGLLSKFKSDGSGRRQIVALRFTGDGILPRAGTAEYGIQAILRSEVLVGRREDFDPIVDANPELARFFMQLMERHAAISYEWLVNCGRRDSTARVAHLLCETVERSHVDVNRQALTNPFTQQQIADITGQTSVNVNRVFADLERQGLISRKGREITFEDWNEIQRVGSFHTDYLN
ncbi:MAG: Crp/Fnr family transcriptional regulator [Sphingomicrobium sp.]